MDYTRRHSVCRCILWADFLSYSAEKGRIPAVFLRIGTAENWWSAPLGEIDAVFSSGHFAGPFWTSERYRRFE